MFKPEAEQDRLFAMIRLLNKGSRVSTPSLLKAADEKTREEHDALAKTFYMMTRLCYPKLVSSIIPINNEDSFEMPDFCIYFKERDAASHYNWLSKMELEAKVLKRDDSELRFRQSNFYLHRKGIVIVLAMDRSIPASLFKDKFSSELDRIGDLFNRDDS